MHLSPTVIATNKTRKAQLYLVADDLRVTPVAHEISPDGWIYFYAPADRITDHGRLRLNIKEQTEDGQVLGRSIPLGASVQ